jgi:serine/threonine-protein kinase
VSAEEPQASPSALAPGHAVAGRYEVVGPLGEGGTGTAYLARDRATDGDATRVVLKVIHRHLAGDRQIAGRLRREAEILERLSGDHLVALLDVLEDDGRLVLVLEHVEGRSLEDFLRDRAPLAPGLAIEIGLQLCAALGVAHAGGVVHRDLKPANVLVSDSPSSPGGVHVRVLDFGLAKIVHGDRMVTGLTEQDMIFGTPEYMAPEQARGDDVDARADLYAVGVMLYEMTTGAVPFHGKSPIATMSAHLAEMPRPPRAARPDLSPALEAVLLRALAKAREDRFPSARSLAEALAAAREPAHVVAPPSGRGAAIDLGDTDLHLEASALTPARVVVGDARPEDAALDATAAPGTIAAIAKVPSAPAPAPSVKSRPPAPARASAAVDELAPTRRAPRVRGSGVPYAWIAIAVVAVLVGIALGVIFGAR